MRINGRPVVHLCPRGHVVNLLDHQEDRRGLCGRCDNTVFPERFLIPVDEKLPRKHYTLYARAYRRGYRAALPLAHD